jgi:hypothetical protein
MDFLGSAVQVAVKKKQFSAFIGTTLLRSFFKHSSYNGFQF